MVCCVNEGENTFYPRVLEALLAGETFRPQKRKTETCRKQRNNERKKEEIKI
jgi:hypothetical protein